MPPPHRSEKAWQPNENPIYSINGSCHQCDELPYGRECIGHALHTHIHTYTPTHIFLMNGVVLCFPLSPAAPFTTCLFAFMHSLAFFSLCLFLCWQFVQMCEWKSHGTWCAWLGDSHSSRIQLNCVCCARPFRKFRFLWINFGWAFLSLFISIVASTPIILTHIILYTHPHQVEFVIKFFVLILAIIRLKRPIVSFAHIFFFFFLVWFLFALA